MTHFVEKMQDVRDILLSVCPNVYHFEGKPNLNTYIVWNEVEEDSPLYVDNKRKESQLEFEINLYTKEEYCPLIDDIPNAFEEKDCYYPCYLANSYYETDSGYFHYVYSFTG